MKKIEITEEDIFYYSLYPEDLSKEKIKFIEERIDEFRDEIELCRKSNSEKRTNSFAELKKKLNERLSENSRDIVLLPIATGLQYEEKYSLAAASPSPLITTEAFSYMDSKSEYLARVVKKGTESLIYVFSKENISTVKLTIYPSKSEYIIDGSSDPIKYRSSERIEKIKISKIN